MQQINLYQPQQRALTFSLTSKWILLAGLLVALLLLAIAGQRYLTLMAVQEQLGAGEQLRDQQQALVNQLSQQMTPRVRDPLLKDRLARAEQRLQYRRQLFTLLQQQQESDDSGFSGYLASLVRQDIPELWLTHINIAAGGRELLLEGEALRSEWVPHYIQRLSREPIFRGTSFHNLTISRPQIKQGVGTQDLPKVNETIQFSMRTALAFAPVAATRP